MIRRLAEATLDYLKFTFGVMVVVTFLFTIISLSHSRPSIIAEIVVVAITTKAILMIITWCLSKTKEMEHATIEVVLVMLTLEFIVFFLPIEMLVGIKEKVSRRGRLI